MLTDRAHSARTQTRNRGTSLNMQLCLDLARGLRPSASSGRAYFASILAWGAGTELRRRPNGRPLSRAAAPLGVTRIQQARLARQARVSELPCGARPRATLLVDQGRAASDAAACCAGAEPRLDRRERKSVLRMRVWWRRFSTRIAHGLAQACSVPTAEGCCFDRRGGGERPARDRRQ